MQIVDEAMIREAAIKMDRGAKVRRTHCTTNHEPADGSWYPDPRIIYGVSRIPGFRSGVGAGYTERVRCPTATRADSFIPS